jgi:2-polyprenyl-3-methyl-5-hydroxy-6-metoxy-1,4-benzoquinol methylase
VTAVKIRPNDDTALPGQYDVIFCLETFEHLPRPLSTLQHFDAALKPRGVLVFDYIKSEATFLDTEAALRDRKRALAFVLERFEVVDGAIKDDDSNLGPTVVRKRG